MGCPTTYDGKTATWSKGKLTKLSSGTLETGLKNYTYTYNGFGQRVARNYTYSKLISPDQTVVSGELTASSKKYYYDHAGRLISEEVSKTYRGEGTTTERIVFLYDESSIIGMEYTVGSTTSTYYFHRNLLGDVIGIYDTSGALVAKYLYDAWGNCTIASETTNRTVANANPIRYRGYYYDDDTGLYYCNARYYSPKWRRFISPATGSINPNVTNGLNTYVYANNNPIGAVNNNTSFSDSRTRRSISASAEGLAVHPSYSSYVSGKKRSSQISWPKANFVAMEHHTKSAIQDPALAWAVGNISYTATVQFNQSETFYCFVDDGNDGCNAGFGIYLGEWCGVSVYGTSNIGLGFSGQFTPWLMHGVEWSLCEGLSFSGGIILGNTTHEITITIGNGPLIGYAICATIATLPVPCARVVAGVAACIIFLVDIFS